MVNQIFQTVLNDGTMRESQALIDIATRAVGDYLPWSF